MWHTAAAAVGGGARPRCGRWGVPGRASGHLEASCRRAGRGSCHPGGAGGRGRRRGSFTCIGFLQSMSRTRDAPPGPAGEGTDAPVHATIKLILDSLYGETVYVKGGREGTGREGEQEFWGKSC